jgi:RNA 2',3'-cyclic 3'-phosphodiesterase
VSESTRIRSFVAIDVEAPIRTALGVLQEEFARTRADVRWVRADGLHVTLKFLGYVEEPRLEQVRAVLTAALAGQAALRVQVHGVGAFPSMRRPRVLWVGLEGAGLPELAVRVEEALSSAGFAKEKREFTPHVTLGRVNSLRGWSALEETCKAHLDDDFGSSDVDAVTIYRSTLRPDGAFYSSLFTIPLNQHRKESRYDTRR